MIHFPWLLTTSSVYVKITPSGITTNLVQLGTSMITSGHELDLKFDPGTYSVDTDGYEFNATVKLNLIVLSIGFFFLIGLEISILLSNIRFIYVSKYSRIIINH